MDELHDRGLDGGDGFDSAADVSAQADRPGRPVDESGQENWTEDAEPLTRGEYADQIRQGPAIGEGDRHDENDSPERAVAEDNQEQEELPEPRTRQEVAEEVGRAEAVPDRDQAEDAELDARLAEEDKLPEPRTRQEVAEAARSGTDPLTRDAALSGNSAAETAENPSPDPDQHEQHGHDQGDNPYARVTVVQADVGDRTFGDTTPVGIGLKPTGDQLMKMENEEVSNPEKLRRKFLEGIDDLNDVARENASLGHDLLMRHHPPTGHAVTEVAHPLPEAPHEGGPAPDIATAGLVAAYC